MSFTSLLMVSSSLQCVCFSVGGQRIVAYFLNLQQYTHSLITTGCFQDAITKMPPLRPLCLILKVFLQQRELNEVYSGGIGSYALLSMLIAQLQLHWKGQYVQDRRVSPERNLGILLVNFFDIKLNIHDVGVSCENSGTFFLKTNRGFLNEDRPYLLSVEDPQAPENDIGRNSFNFAQIRLAFGMAFSMLTSSKSILALGPNRSILGTIIRPDPLLVERKGGSVQWRYHLQ